MCKYTHKYKHKGTCPERLTASYGFLTYFTKVTEGGLTLNMNTLAPKETTYLKQRIKHETNQMTNQAQSEDLTENVSKQKKGVFQELHWAPLKKSGSVFFAPSLQIFLYIDEISLSLPSSRLNSPVLLALPHVKRQSSSQPFSHVATSTISVYFYFFLYCFSKTDFCCSPFED